MPFKNFSQTHFYHIIFVQFCVIHVFTFCFSCTSQSVNTYSVFVNETIMCSSTVDANTIKACHCRLSLSVAKQTSKREVSNRYHFFLAPSTSIELSISGFINEMTVKKFSHSEKNNNK